MSKYGVFSGPYFPAFGLNTERYSVSLRIQSECWKIRTRKTPYFDTFHAVYIYIMQHIHAFVHIRNVLNLFLKLLELRDPFTNAQFYPLIIQFIQQYEFYHH